MHVRCHVRCWPGNRAQSSEHAHAPGGDVARCVHTCPTPQTPRHHEGGASCRLPCATHHHPLAPPRKAAPVWRCIGPHLMPPIHKASPPPHSPPLKATPVWGCIGTCVPPPIHKASPPAFSTPHGGPGVALHSPQCSNCHPSLHNMSPHAAAPPPGGTVFTHTPHDGLRSSVGAAVTADFCHPPLLKRMGLWPQQAHRAPPDPRALCEPCGPRCRWRPKLHVPRAPREPREPRRRRDQR